METSRKRANRLMRKLLQGKNPPLMWKIIWTSEYDVREKVRQIIADEIIEAQAEGYDYKVKVSK